MQRRCAFLFVLFSVFIRLVPHVPNMVPITAVGLFCGAYFSGPSAFLIPLLSLAAGDLLLGWVPGNLFGYIAIALSSLVGTCLRSRRSTGRLIGASLLGSTIFFLISNFGVWMLGCTPGWYPPTVEGLMRCYAAGIPFYQNMLIGDLIYTFILFGSFELFSRGILRSRAVLLASKAQ